MKPLNPFFTTITIPDDYFCGRKQESEELLQLITGGNNVVLKAPRRLGKSSLIMHVLSQKQIQKHYNTFYVDILSTKNVDEFTQAFCDVVTDNDAARRFRFGRKALAVLQSIKATASNLLYSPEAGVGFSPVLPNYRMTLNEIFKFLENTKRPNIVVFDEFQKIADYTTDIEAFLRSKIQVAGNTRFVFSGSEPSVLSMMFEKRNRPFFQSTTPMTLKPIPKDEYIEFAVRQFESWGKSLDKEAVSSTYDLFSGYTSHLQTILNHAFASVNKAHTCDMETIKSAIMRELQTQNKFYSETVAEWSQHEWNLVIAIAVAGNPENLQSQEFVSRYQLGTASKVANSLKNLLKKGTSILTRTGNSYALTDKMFELWIRNKYGISLDYSLMEASGRLARAREMEAAAEAKGMFSDDRLLAILPDAFEQEQKNGKTRKQVAAELRNRLIGIGQSWVDSLATFELDRDLDELSDERRRELDVVHQVDGPVKLYFGRYPVDVLVARDRGRNVCMNSADVKQIIEIKRDSAPSDLMPLDEESIETLSKGYSVQRNGRTYHFDILKKQIVEWEPYRAMLRRKSEEAERKNVEQALSRSGQNDAPAVKHRR